MFRYAGLILLCATMFGQTTAKPADAPPYHYPRVLKAEVPFYPPAPWGARFGGTVEIDITVENGDVIDVELRSVKMKGYRDENNAGIENDSRLRPFLSIPSIENVKTWKFEPTEKRTFLVTFTYVIEGTESEWAETPRVELRLPHSVKLVARPVKPTRTRLLDGGDYFPADASLAHSFAVRWRTDFLRR